MHEFIHSMVLRNSVNAALQRSKVYTDAPSLVRKDFQNAAKTWLRSFGERYDYSATSPEKWCFEIEELSHNLSGSFRKHLRGQSVKSGVNQKMISLWLKYLWLLGDCSKKPLFSVLDRRILAAAGVSNPPSWTTIESPSEYLRVVQAVDDFARSKGYSDGPSWEIEYWSDI